MRVSSCETGRFLFDIDCFDDPHVGVDFEDLALSTDDNLLATFKQNTVNLWDARTGSHHRTISFAPSYHDTYAVRRCTFSPDTRRLVVSCGGRSTFLDTTTGTILGSLSLPFLPGQTESEHFLGCHFTTARPPPCGCRHDSSE